LTAQARGGRRSLRDRRIRRVGEASSAPSDEQITLVETLDRVLRRGIVVHGEVVISVAEIPLVYVGLQAMVSAVGTAEAALRRSESAAADHTSNAAEKAARDASPAPSDRR